MSEKKIVKATSENTCNLIKAIYPHITVSGAVDKPYYNIDWYDIETKTMYRGYSSYNLEFVRKWLEEEFEVVEADIDDLIKRQQSELEALTAENKQLKSDLIIAKQSYDHIRQQWQADRTKAKEAISKYINKHNELIVKEEQLRADAVKEFSKILIDYAEGGSIEVNDLPDLIFVYSGKK